MSNGSEVGSEDFDTSDTEADLSLSDDNEEDVEPRTVQTKEHAATLQLILRFLCKNAHHISAELAQVPANLLVQGGRSRRLAILPLWRVLLMNFTVFNSSFN
ncbi:UNVERIFIED_CONTAM: hypothetical protein FKN15_032412 [Acipenser sinensis]